MPQLEFVSYWAITLTLMLAIILNIQIILVKSSPVFFKVSKIIKKTYLFLTITYLLRYRQLRSFSTYKNKSESFLKKSYFPGFEKTQVSIKKKPSLKSPQVFSSRSSSTVPVGGTGLSNKEKRIDSNDMTHLGFSHGQKYPTPINTNYLWSFGFLSLISLTIMIMTGLFLSMHYNPDTEHAFASVEHIMRDVEYGWFIRYTHANCASMFFIVVYIHILRGLYYKLYLRASLWWSGVIIYILMMATAFLGYVLPWGQMSYWGATVITNFVRAIPTVGDDLGDWLWGGFSVGNNTLHRFYSLHFILPFIIFFIVAVHITLVHREGSSNPLGVPNVNTLPFFPYFWLKDLIALWVFLFILVDLVCFYPNALGHPSNYIPANGMTTPAHIVPEWYFLPFYAILRAMPTKGLGLIAMGLAIIVLFFLPFLDKPNHLFIQARRSWKFFYWIFVADVALLTWIGAQEVAEPYTTIGQLATLYYFLFFVAFLPVSTWFDNQI